MSKHFSRKLNRFIYLLSTKNHEILNKIKTLFAKCPILIFELNKFMPKNNKLPLVTQDNADEFLQKLKNKDESCYKEIIKLILQYKDENINTETLANKTEEVLNKYPELLEEALLFIDYKKINTLNFRKNINKNNSNNNIQNNSNNNINQNNIENTQINQKKENRQQNQTLSPKSYDKYSSISRHHYRHDMNQLAPKIQSSPDFVFFAGLKEIFSPEIYKIIPEIKKYFG